MASRTGVPTLIHVAEQLCKYIAKYGNTIKLLYPSNAALAAALDAAMAACSVLDERLKEVRATGD